MSIEDYAWQHAEKLTEAKDIEKVLEWFVARVRSGKSVNRAVLEFIATGVEQRLAGKKPWGAKRGVKKKDLLQAMENAFPVHATFQRIGTKYLKRGVRPDPKQVHTETAEERGISEDTVKRAVAAVEEGRKAYPGVYRALMEFETLVNCMKSDEGRAWLKTPEGKAWLEKSPGVKSRLA